MSSDFCIDSAATPRRQGAGLVLRAALLVSLGLVASYGLGKIAGAPATGPAPAGTAAPMPLEDWHGNVRRSTGGW